MQFRAKIQGSRRGFARRHLPESRHERFSQNHGSKCWELDAMNPNDLQERVENAILDHIDEEVWDHAVEVERSEIESLRGLADRWKSILTQASK
jgi:hypothetical protein